MAAHRWGRSRRGRLAWRAALGALAALALPTPAAAQPGREGVPTFSYFQAFSPYYDGEYRQALSSFRAEGRGAIKSASSRWIDSICYHTMTGECYYQMGQLDQALEQYTSALKLYLNEPNWMLRVQFPAAVQPAGVGARAQVPWGASQRTARIGHFPDSFSMGQGQINNNDAVRNGGVVRAPVYVPVHVAEIVRATTLAMRRRRELLGPLCKHDPITKQLVTAMGRRTALGNHWAGAWLDVQYGAALASAGNATQAAAALERAIVVQGEFDHPLTATALFELGLLALEAGDLPVATGMFEEASYSAATFLDPGLLEEAMRWGQTTYLIGSGKGLFPPLKSAAAWARVKGYRQLQTSLLLLAAENLSARGEAQAAASALDEARAAMARSDLAASLQGTRHSFLTALAMYQLAKTDKADAALAAALTAQKSASRWLLQIKLLDGIHVARSDEVNFSDRVRLQLFEAVLREPTPLDWALSPLECVTVLATAHPWAYEHWFEAALKRDRAPDLAVEVADRARRHRFYSALPLGGRLLSLRWVLEAPQDQLTQSVLSQRQELLARFPQYGELARRAGELRGKLLAAPLAPEAADARKDQSRGLAELAELAARQEAILRQIALQHEPSELVFPPLRKLKDVQAALPPGHVVLVYFVTSATSKNLHGFLFARDKYASWQYTSGAAAGLQKNLSAWLRDLGCADANLPVAAGDLAQSAWKKSGVRLLEQLVDKSRIDLGEEFQELTIVPDGVLWYVPFEALPVGKPDPRPLLSKARLRYAPTLGLAVCPPRDPQPAERAAIVLGKLFPQDSDESSRRSFDALSKALPDAAALPLNSALPAASSIYRALFGSLVVWDDIEPEGGLDWSPAQLDRGKPGGALAQWLTLPWGSPRVVVLPGYHTAAENALRKNSALGNDLFLAACGLMATGTRTMLISRWRAGGQTSVELTREFLQGLDEMHPSDAWQRSVQLAMESPLDVSAEPRVKAAASIEGLKSEHPFFWAGYLLVDSGSGAALPEPAAPAAKLELKNPLAAAADPAAAGAGGKKPARVGPGAAKGR